MSIAKDRREIIMRQKIKMTSLVAAIFLTLGLMLTSCGQEPQDVAKSIQDVEQSDTETDTNLARQDKENQEKELYRQVALEFDYGQVPEYSGKPYVVINDNQPFFKDEEITSESYELYGDLDTKGRCTTAMACVGKDLFPTEERGEIGSVKPTGWHTVKYDGIDGNYLYNRCHLLMYALSGENANVRNLITGTRYMNKDGMLPFEERIHNYIEDTDNHVMYRVSPVFVDEEMVARGVLMEAYSVEDQGKGICLCVFCYNVQPGVTINYQDGSSSGPEYTGAASGHKNGAQYGAGAATNGIAAVASQGKTDTPYVANKNSGKFHRADCPSVDKMSDNNKVYYNSREDAIKDGYEGCKNCNP